MKDEIKEILDNLKNYANEGGEHTLMEYEIKHIQCYITNLQEENERLKAELELYKDNHNYLNDKIEKAIEYIKSNFDNTGWLEIGSQDVEVLINILQGKSDE